MSPRRTTDRLARNRSRFGQHRLSSDQKLLYAAASVTATLSIIEVGRRRKIHLKALVPTVKGARGVVAGKGETAYLIDPAKDAPEVDNK